jgi:hypothetical protein
VKEDPAMFGYWGVKTFAQVVISGLARFSPIRGLCYNVFMSNDNRREQNLLRSILNAGLPADRAAEEQKLSERDRETKRKYTDPRQLAQLREQLTGAQAQYAYWQKNNPTASAYLEHINVWKKGWEPVLPEDREQAQAAEQSMRVIEGKVGIKYADVRSRILSVADLVEMGFSPDQIGFLKALAEGEQLSNKASSIQETLNYVESLLKSKQ